MSLEAPGQILSCRFFQNRCVFSRRSYLLSKSPCRMTTMCFWMVLTCFNQQAEGLSGSGFERKNLNFTNHNPVQVSSWVACSFAHKQSWVSTNSSWKLELLLWSCGIVHFVAFSLVDAAHQVEFVHPIPMSWFHGHKPSHMNSSTGVSAGFHRPWRETVLHWFSMVFQFVHSWRLQNRWRNTAAWSSGNPGFYPTSWSSPKTKAETLAKNSKDIFQTCRKHRKMMYFGPWPWLVHYQQLLVTSCDSWCTGSRLQFYFPLSSTWFSSGACSLDKGKTR